MNGGCEYCGTSFSDGPEGKRCCPQKEVDLLTADNERLRKMLQQRDERIRQLEEALRFLDPRNATARYDQIADDFQRATGLWPPGRSRPAAMGPDPDPELAQLSWRKFCDGWHEAFFDSLGLPPPTGYVRLTDLHAHGCTFTTDDGWACLDSCPTRMKKGPVDRVR